MGNYFQKYAFKVLARSHFCEIWESPGALSTKMAEEIYAKLRILNRPAQPERRKLASLDFIFTQFVISRENTENRTRCYIGRELTDLSSTSEL